MWKVYLVLVVVIGHMISINIFIPIMVLSRMEMCARGGYGYFPYTSLKKDIPLIDDGGNILIHVLIDLKQNKVIHFRGNGCA